MVYWDRALACSHGPLGSDVIRPPEESRVGPVCSFGGRPPRRTWVLQDPGVNCSLGDAVFPQKRGVSRECCWDGPTAGSAELGMESRENERNQLCAHSEFKVRQELVLDFQEDLGSFGYFGSPSPNPSL